MLKTRLTAWSLNGNRFLGKSPGEESPALTWLKSLSEPGAIVPDVLCLQDFRVSLLQHLRPLPHFYFAPTTNHLVWGKRELKGNLIASRYPIDDISVRYTWGNGIVKDLDGVGDDNERIKPDDKADRLVLSTEDCVAMAVSVCVPKRHGGGRWRFATHRGLWVRGGVTTPEQMQNTEQVCRFLVDDAYALGGLVYLADCSLDRNGEVFGRYNVHGADDCLPPDIKTTLADNHPAARLGAKPTRVMLFPGHQGNGYEISGVHTDGSPGANHKMLCCTVSKLN